MVLTCSGVCHALHSTVSLKPAAVPSDAFLPSYAQTVPESYTVVEIGGHQLIVEKGRWYEINRLQAPPGSIIRLGRVLAHKANGDIRFGKPYLDDVTIHAKILEEFQGPKITVFKFKPKKHYKRTAGHRQQLTRFLVTEVVEGGEVGASHEDDAS